MICLYNGIKSLPTDKILNLSNLKACADDNRTYATQEIKFLPYAIIKIVGKGENAGYQHFLLFSLCFQKVSFSGSLKVGIVLKSSVVKDTKDWDSI